MNKASSYSLFSVLFFISTLIVSCNGQPKSQESEKSNEEPEVMANPIIPYVVTDSLVRSIFEDSKGNYYGYTNGLFIDREKQIGAVIFTNADQVSPFVIDTFRFLIE